MEEKYRLCDDTLTDLLAWIGEIEDRLANQDVVQEDVNQLRNQINILKVIRIRFLRRTSYSRNRYF